MGSGAEVTSDTVALRPFVPAKDLELSLRFYAELGFTTRKIGDGIGVAEMEPFSFLLQAYDVPSFAEHYMMQWLVDDLDALWTRVHALDLPGKYGVQAPRAPAVQPWGLTVAYVFDPTGVLWHLVQRPK